jgi:hypothetical protein
MANPGPPHVISPEPWHLSDGDTVDFYFDVPGAPHWTRPEEARLAQSPCGGPPTLLTTTSSTQPRRFRVQVHIHWAPNWHVRRSTLEAIWAAKGPYTLVAPPIDPSAMTVICDASQGALEWSPDDGRYTATVGFQEIA